MCLRTDHLIFDGEGRKRGGGVGGEGDSCGNTKAAIMENAGKNGTSKRSRVEGVIWRKAVSHLGSVFKLELLKK